MSKFMYLFRSNPGAARSMSPEQMQQAMKKWMDGKKFKASDASGLRPDKKP